MTTPIFRRIWPYQNPSDFDYFVEGLREAGLEEGSGGVRDEASSAEG